MSNNTIYGQMLHARKNTIERTLVPVMVERLTTYIDHHLMNTEPASGYKPALVQIHPDYIDRITSLYKEIEDDVMSFPMARDHSHLQALLYNFSRLFFYFMHHPGHGQKEALVAELLRHHITQRLWYRPLTDFITHEERELMLSSVLNEWSKVMPGEFFNKDFSVTDLLRNTRHPAVSCVVRLVRAYALILDMDVTLHEELKNLPTRLTSHGMNLRKWHDKSHDYEKEIKFDLNPLTWIPREGPLSRILNPQGDEIKEPLSVAMDNLCERFYKPAKTA